MIFLIPQAEFLKKKVSRLIVGDNPVNGHSYIPDLITGSEMSEYFTVEQTVEAFFEAEVFGYNTMIPLACPKIFKVLEKYYEAGGSMNIIFQPFPAIPFEENLIEMKKFNPIGIYHQGTTTDYYNETGQNSITIDNIKRIKDSGIPAGLGTHVPETVLLAESENWGCDFYMAALYNARRNRRGEQSGFITGKTKADLIFYPEDRFLMYDVIKSINKPFIAFKIFAGGQIFTGHTRNEYYSVAKKYMKELFENIKENDIAAIGFMQRDFNQLKQNSDIIKSLFC